MKLVHISDLHVKAIPRDNENVRAKLAGVRTMLGPGDSVVLTGDVTDDGLERQYENALELLRQFKGRIIMCPGNHDFGLMGSFYREDSAKHWAKLCEKLEVRPVTNLHIAGFQTGRTLALNTCVRKGSPVDFAQGKVGFFQLRQLKKFLEQCHRERLTSVVLLHHNPYYSEWYCRLQDAKKFFDTILGKADYVLVGHEHKARHSWYPMKEVESKALTHMYAADALYKDDAHPTVISLRENP